MPNLHDPTRSANVAIVAAIALLACAPFAHAQLHEKSQGPYRARANLVSSMFLEPSVAQLHGIEQARDLAILNVTVTGPGGVKTVPAKIQARVGAPRGALRPLEMRGIAQNDGLSYLGTFRVAPGDEVEVELDVRPEGLETPIEMRFVDRVPPI